MKEIDKGVVFPIIGAAASLVGVMLTIFGQRAEMKKQAQIYGEELGSYSVVKLTDPIHTKES